MHRKITCVAALPYAVILAATTVGGPLTAQNVHAARVVAFDDRGQLGGGSFDPSRVLGRPDGAVHSLGQGGWITLGFDVTLVDGPGADLIVAENPFRSFTALNETFAEVAFVEVSSDGVDFARFPARYTGPQAQPGPFSFLDSGHYANLTGRFAVRTGASDVQDVVDAGGDAFDLADLATHPLVVAGRVDLNAITQVRIVDAVSGIDTDARGVPVFDTGGAGSADIDGITVIHHTANRSPDGPAIDLAIAGDGRFTLTVSDPNGLTDLDPASLRAALWSNEIPFADLFAVSAVTQVSATSFTMVLGGPLPPGVNLAMQVAVKDFAGRRSGACRTRP